MPKQHLTEQQIKFLANLTDGNPKPVWPGPSTRIAHNLERRGLIALESDLAKITPEGRTALQETRA